MPQVLVIEDNDLNRQLFTDLLHTRGIKVVSVQTGAEGLLELEKGYTPDVILMDMQLPDQHGLEVVKTLKSRPESATIPVVAVTAFALQGDREKFLSGGCSGYLSKPISIEGFFGTLEAFLDQKTVNSG